MFNSVSKNSGALQPQLPIRFIGSLACTSLARSSQSIFSCLHPVELTLGLPPFALGASLLFHPINYPMRLLILVVSSRSFSVRVVILAPAVIATLKAPPP